MTDRYAVFGNPLSHTKSPQIHAAFARQFGEDMTYEAVEAPLDGFPTTFRDFLAAGGAGGNVTVPFKVEAHDMADDLSDAARLCGAANTLKQVDGRLFADNTDGVGLVRDITENLGVTLQDKHILIAGAGGATRGATAPLLAAGAASITIANRTLSKARAIRDLLADRGTIHALPYDAATGPFDIVINSTSTSLTGAKPPLPPSAFGSATLAYDLAYGKGLTPFLAEAQKTGTRIADGVGMLVEQAAEAFFIWRGKRPNTAALIQELTIPLT